MRKVIHQAAKLCLCAAIILIGFSDEGATQLTTFASGTTGRISFQSLNLTSAQFEAGTKEVPSITVTADLALPDGEGRLPAVILFHGSGGISGSERGWASLLPRIGVATFMVDSFTPRRVTGAPSEEQLSRAGQVIDSYRALELLVTHPRIDRGRIALNGIFPGWRPDVAGGHPTLPPGLSAP